MEARAWRTLAWAWLPAFLVVLVAIGAWQWHATPSGAGAPGGSPVGAGCSTSALQSFLGCP